jgi:hypothetical protein
MHHSTSITYLRTGQAGQYLDVRTPQHFNNVSQNRTDRTMPGCKNTTAFQ